MGGGCTHVVFGRTAPLLHVHHFDVQHSPELHLDPAEVMHRGVRAAAPDGLYLRADQVPGITAFIALPCLRLGQFGGDSAASTQPPSIGFGNLATVRRSDARRTQTTSPRKRAPKKSEGGGGSSMSSAEGTKRGVGGHADYRQK